jgi:hypothetical protein
MHEVGRPIVIQLNFFSLFLLRRSRRQFGARDGRVFFDVAGGRPFAEFRGVVFIGIAHDAKLFQAVAFFDFSVGEARLAFVAHAGFGQIKIIVQILQFLAQRGSMVFSFHNFDFAPVKNFVQKKLYRLLLCEAVQRAEAPDQIHGVNACDSVIASKLCWNFRRRLSN